MKYTIFNPVFHQKPINTVGYFIINSLEITMILTKLPALLSNCINNEINHIETTIFNAFDTNRFRRKKQEQSKPAMNYLGVPVVNL